MKTPKRYQFDQPAPSEPAHLPSSRPQPLVEQQSPQIVHIHQAAPDRTVQRLAAGAGMGAGAVAAGVYFGPLLVATMASMAVSLAVVALVICVTAWAVVAIVKSVNSTDAIKGRRRG